MTTRRTSTLAQLERQLAAVTAQRDRIISDLKAAVAGLTTGVSYFVAAERKQFGPSVSRAVKRTRRFSRAARARLAAAAKRRWAEAKKAGKKRLG